jgi:hypothetical protein
MAVLLWVERDLCPTRLIVHRRYMSSSIGEEVSF